MKQSIKQSMQQGIQVLGAALAMTALAGTLSLAQPKPAASTAALRRIQANATWLRHDASIYQWERVDNEVDRIVAAARSLQKGLGSGDAATLSEAVHALRSAGLSRDVAGLSSAAEKLSSLSSDLLKADR